MAHGGVHVRVPVAEVAGEASRAVFLRLGVVIEVGWLPLLIVLAASTVPQLVLTYLTDKTTATALARLPDLIDAVASVLCLSAFAVRWAQIITPGGEAAASSLPFWSVWLRFIIVTLPLTLPTLASLLIPPVSQHTVQQQIAAMPPTSLLLLMLGAVAFQLLPCLLMTRLALLLPAAARGQSLGVADAWRLMHGNSWRMIGTGCLACLPFLLAVQVLLSGVDTDDLFVGSILLIGLAETLKDLILSALAISIAAGFYRRIAVLGRI